MRSKLKPLTSTTNRVRKDRESLKTNIPMDIIRLLQLEDGSEIRWDAVYERRQVIISKHSDRKRRD